MSKSDLPLETRLARAITLGGPISVAQFMATANTAYYGARDPLGSSGDFITAPEISQMFGELVGLWAADLCLRADKPPLHYVELGPGRGTLAVDALRAMAQFGLTPPVHFIENSPALQALQHTSVPDAICHDRIDHLPHDSPLIIIANEFFDALPVQQVVRTVEGWHQRMITYLDELFVPIIGKQVPDEVIPAHLRAAPPGSIFESSPLSVNIVSTLAAQIERQGGALLIIDYGYSGPALGDTLQAVRAHQRTNPFAAIGEQDLSAHVDFATLAAAGIRAGLNISGPVEQGAWLNALGIAERATRLAEDHPNRADIIETERIRLTSDAQMGLLFKVMAMTANGWGEPAGF